MIFDHHFGVRGDAQKNVRTVEGVKKRPRFSLTKNVLFAFNFEAFPECNPIFGDLRQETFMAARLKPNLRMAESTLRKAGSTADAAQQNFQFFCFFNFIFCFFFERGPHGTVVFSGRPYPKPFQHTVEKEQNQDKKNSRTLESCVRPEFCIKPFSTVCCFFDGRKK